MFDLSRFVDACRGALRKPDPARAVHDLMSEAISEPAAIEAALGAVQLPDGSTAQYNFLHQSPELTILNVVMPGGLQSPPHNHLIWAVIGMYQGRENNVFYRREGGGIVESGKRNLRAPEVMTLPPDIIHGISNPLARQSCGLHVYGGSLSNPARSLWNPFTFKEEAFQVAAMSGYEQELMRRARAHSGSALD